MVGTRGDHSMRLCVRPREPLDLDKKGHTPGGRGKEGARRERKREKKTSGKGELMYRASVWV